MPMDADKLDEESGAIEASRPAERGEASRDGSPVASSSKSDLKSPLDGLADATEQQLNSGPSALSSLTQWGRHMGLGGTLDTLSTSLNTALTVAKEATSEICTLVADDVAERKVLMEQTQAYIKESANSVAKTVLDLEEKTDIYADMAIGQICNSASTLWGVATGYGFQSVDDEGDEEVAVTNDDNRLHSSAASAKNEQLRAELHLLASNEQTFVNVPTVANDVDFNTWPCDLDERRAEIDELLTNNVIMRDQHARLVPDKVTDADFWRRYFFHVHIIQRQQQKRIDLRRRVAECARANDDMDQDAAADWDADESGADCVAVSDALADASRDAPPATSRSSSREADVKSEEGSVSSTEWDHLSEEQGGGGRPK